MGAAVAAAGWGTGLAGSDAVVESSGAAGAGKMG